MKKICVVTGTRAEYGLLKPLIERIDKDEEVQLQLVVTGMHLSPEFGMTYKEIEEDGYTIDHKLEILMSSDTPVGISKTMGLTIIGFGEYLEQKKPDIIIILGDRYEMLMIASAAMIARIPIAHIHGGETTEGAIDEAIRHSITKMSHLHFATTDVYRNRIIQLGEQPENVYNVGALGVENIKNITLLSKKQLEEQLHISLEKDIVLVTFHPVTLESITAEEQFNCILKVLNKHSELFVVFTGANADTDGRAINRMIADYVENNSETSVYFTSLGQLRYLSILQYCRFVLGNSSSGIIEVPSFGIPTINIGDRQKGRVHADTVIDCECTETQVENAIYKALSTTTNNIINPYEMSNTSKNIVGIIKRRLDEGIELKKFFYDIGNKL